MMAELGDRIFDDQHLFPAMAKWRRWCGVEKFSTQHTVRQFTLFLGFELHEPPLEGYFALDTRKPEVRALLMKINGPHGATILKMLELKNKGELDG